MNINNDYDKAVYINENDLQWEDKSAYLEKVLSIDEDKKTSIICFDSSCKNSQSQAFCDAEIFVLEGVYCNEHGCFNKGTYLNLADENQEEIYTNSSCKVFKKINYKRSDKNIIIDTSKDNWQQGYGNLQVYPLFENTALVKWPENEKFIPHKHWGGEEIFVLDGIFYDEHGEFAKGTWMRSPHLSTHHPFVKDETLIFVKTGHM